MIRRLLPLFVLLAALVAPATASAADAGLNINGGAASGTPDNYSQLQDTGAKWARHFLYWDNIDESGLRLYDQIVAEEGRRGIKTLFVVAAASRNAPANPQQYADFVGVMAKRWKGQLEAVEIWNEQDETTFWRGGPQPDRYVDLLQRSYTAVKANDQSMQVVFGPLTGNNYGFLEAAYAAGAKGYFDVMAAHTDTACLVDGPSKYYRDNGRLARFTFLGYRELRATMLANGDDKPVWLTEIGWSAAPHTCEVGMWAGQKLAGVTEDDQAKYMLEAFHCLKQDSYVQVAMWFNNRDLVPDGKMDNMYGLLRFDGSRRPAYGAFQDYARNGDRLTEPCGDFGAPGVQVLSPKADAIIGPNEALPLRATSGDKDVLRMTFAVKGAPKEIRNFTNGGKPLDLANGLGLTWQGAKKLGFGNHTIVVTAIDAQGNAGSAEVAVRKIDPRRMGPQKTGFVGLRVLGSGLRRSLVGRAKTTMSFALPGKVTAEWQMKRGGRWKKMHGAKKNANRAFRFNQRLRSKGTWRVRAVYVGKRPFRKSASAWKTFRVR